MVTMLKKLLNTAFLLFPLTLVVLVMVFSSVAQARDYKNEGVTVTASSTWKPYSYIGVDGKPAGFLIDVWEKWSSEMGIPVYFKMLTWEESLSKVADGTYDIQSGLIMNEERSKLFGFSLPFYMTKTVKLVRKDTSCDLSSEGQRWGLVAKTSGRVILAEQYPEVERVPFQSIPIVMTALVEKEIDAAAIPLSTASLTGRELNISDKLKVCETLWGRELRAGVAKGNPLLYLVDEGFSKIDAKEKRVLVHRWFMVQEEESFIQAWFVPSMVAIVFIAFGIAFLVSQYFTKKQGL